MARSNRSQAAKHWRLAFRLCHGAFALALFGLLVLVAPRVRAAEEVGARQLGQDTFRTGSHVRIAEEVQGDAVLAGESIEVTSAVLGDGMIAGRTLELRGAFGSDLYAAGGEVRVHGDIGGNARLAGRDVTLAPESDVRGGVSIAAGRAEIAGNIEQYLRVFAGSTLIDGRVAGDVDVSGGELRLGPSARVDGRVIFKGPQPATIAPGARVSGDVSHVAEPERPGPSLALFLLIGGLGMGLLGAIAWALFPGISRRTEDIALGRSGSALLAGLALVVAGPPIIALLIMSLIGVPLAVLAICLYLALFPVGYLTAAASVADRVLERARPQAASRRGPRIAVLLLVLVVLALLTLVPVLGPLVAFTLTLLGIGALVIAAFDARKRRKVGTTAPQAYGRPRAHPEEPAPAST